MSDKTDNSVDPKNIARAEVRWTNDLIFAGGAAGSPDMILDGDGKAGQSMVNALLHAAASCVGADVVSILEKMKVGLESYRMEVTGVRNADFPRRVNHLTIKFFLKGSGLTRVNAERAVALSIEKYCSVLHSLNPDIPVEREIVIE